MTSYGVIKRIKTIDDVIATMDEIMMGIETHEFTHQYKQVLAIHRETAKIESRLDAMDDKLDKMMGRLEYLCASDTEKKYLYSDGSVNYDAINKSCDDINIQMLEMRDKDGKERR